jgi:hypothetical protein
MVIKRDLLISGKNLMRLKEEQIWTKCLLIPNLHDKLNLSAVIG